MSTRAPARARARALCFFHKKLDDFARSSGDKVGTFMIDHLKMLPKHPQPASQPPSQYGHFLAWGDQEPFGGLLSGFGAFQKRGFPICELLIKLGTFWLGATRKEPFFGIWGPSKKRLANM